MARRGGPKFPVNNGLKGRKRTEVVDIYDFHLFEDCIQFSSSSPGQQMELLAPSILKPLPFYVKTYKPFYKIDRLKVCFFEREHSDRFDRVHFYF